MLVDDAAAAAGVAPGRRSGRAEEDFDRPIGMDAEQPETEAAA